MSITDELRIIAEAHGKTLTELSELSAGPGRGGGGGGGRSVVTYDPNVFENPRAVAEYLHRTAVEQQDGISDVSTYTSPTEAGGGA